MISHRSKQFVYPDYISPLPADEFLKAAKYKQSMYDEGVALVNKQLDAYQSIRDSLNKPQDKKYFDQEATKFVNALNKNASLDLSVKSNLQSTLQSGNQLVHDPYIKQAAESSAVYKKMIEEQSKLDPSKRSRVNDYFFNKDIESWYNDGKVGSKLRYNPYTVYTDEHTKLWSTLVDKMKPDTTEEYIQDKSGAWITKVTYTGKSAEKLRNAYQDGLSDQAKNQLRMEAQYELETGDKNKLTQDYIQFNQLATQQIGSEIVKAELEKGEYVKKYGENSPEASNLTNQIYELKLKQSIYEENANKTPEDGDLTSYIINEKVINASNDWAYKQAKKDTIANPYMLDREKMKNNIIEAEAKAKINALYGLDPEGKAINAGIPLGYSELPAAQISSTTSLLTDNKLLANNRTNLIGAMDNEVNPYLTAGIASYLDVDQQGNTSTTIKDILKRTLVSPTWNADDRNNIIVRLSGGDALTKAIQQNPKDKEAFVKIAEANQKKADLWLKNVQKIGGSVFDVYDLQAGGYAGRDQGKITDILLNNEQVDIKNVNTQGNRASAIKAEIPNGSDAETFNNDGTGLTFVPKVGKNESVVFVVKDAKGKNLQRTMSLNDFFNLPSSDLLIMEDIRTIPAAK